MRFGLVAPFLALAFAAGTPQLSTAQQGERVLHHVAEVHVKPGMAAQFEAAHLARNERLRAAGVSFPLNASVSESLVYRFFTPVGDYEGLATRQAEMAGIAPAAPGTPSANEAIDHVESYLRWIEPDLGYLPEDPRIENGEWGVVQRVRLYVRQGALGEVTDALRDLAELYGAHNSRERRIIARRALGSDSPGMEVFLFGTDMSDLYMHTAQTVAELGDPLREIRGRIASASRRIEIENFTVRPDLGYQPPS